VVTLHGSWADLHQILQCHMATVLPPQDIPAGLLGLGLGLKAKFSGLGLVFLALALFKAKVCILKESSINIGICETFLFSLHLEYLM